MTSRLPKDILGSDWVERPIDLLLACEGLEFQKKPRDVMDKPWHPEDSFCKRVTEDVHWRWIRVNRAAKAFHREARRVERSENIEYLTELGRETVKKLIEKGAVCMDDINDQDRQRAEDALAYAVGVMKDPDAKHRDGISAASLILGYCKAKPASASNVTVSRAEDFLSAIEDV